MLFWILKTFFVLIIIIIAYGRRKRFLAHAYNITLQTECIYICADDKSGTSLEKNMHHLTKINPKYIECCLNWKTYKENNTDNVDT